MRARLSAFGMHAALGVLLLWPAPVEAQGSPPRPSRSRLEQQVRREFARAVRERVGLTDAQMAQLAPLTQKHERQRRALQREEGQARLALQGQLRSPAPDTAAVSGLLETLLDVQRRRLAMIESEHRDLATVMTPVQRARYLGLQEQVRRRVEQMRRGSPR